jgi:hypothetical protein
MHPMRCSAGLVLTLAACHQTPQPPPVAETATIADRAWLTQSLWDDGKSEVAFYEGWIGTGDARRTFELATQLTKQNFDPAKQTKSETGVPDFKWTLFYERTEGSEQFKHSYVANFMQASLQPLKVSANRFDWCSNQYRELAFTPGVDVHVLARSDDYGNDERTVPLAPLTYPAVGVPLLIRAVDFSRMKQVDFSVVLMDGTHVGAMVELVGTEGDAEKIIVHYAHAIDSTFGPRAQKEIYWRGLDPARSLLKMESEDGNYGVTSVETIRAAYWQENIFDKLTRVKSHP